MKHYKKMMYFLPNNIENLLKLYKTQVNILVELHNITMKNISNPLKIKHHTSTKLIFLNK